MNNKRQTIWLVSMLSLMVVLSAYYLFTEDSGTTAPPVADSAQVSNQEGMNTASVEELVTNEVIPENKTNDLGAGEVSGSSANNKNAKSEKAADPKDPKVDANVNESKSGETVKTEEDVLKQMAANTNSAASKLESYMLDRANENTKLHDELMTKLGNQESSAEETAQVTEQLKKLEEREEILLSLEEELQQKFENAVVKEENGRYNVVVLGEKLDNKGAADIVDKVMSELKVGQDKVSVQLVKP
ncbi:SpoIIIAH-like family protein [Paenibacillus dakarensis]|uniref:SpoIIIAH-like family protein n=1 Tax=Paenibacillus dakarensis TaxID=1527293 RepID=UPI0006D58328|nr:SpoIIIAH-like family protein [Paenibacillus dakarensis]